MDPIRLFQHARIARILRRTAAGWIVLGASLAAGTAAGAFAQEPESGAAVSTDAPAPQPGSIHGVVMSADKTVYEGVRVQLAEPGDGTAQSATSDAEGRFNFERVPAGSFTLTAWSPGFVAQTVSGVLQPGEEYEAPAIVLPMSTASSVVRVTATQEEIATAQVKLEEKQRLLGVVPNFYVVYDAHPAPLRARQKWALAWREQLDPVTFLSAGFFSGIQQAQNTFAGYGQGAAGYAKRYGANYASGFSGAMLGGAFFPSIFHQDPRYYYKGTGSIASRALYAIAMAAICKGDNGHWQFNYSGLAGGVAAGELANLYYPASDRSSWHVVVDGNLIAMGESTIGNLFQEFVARRLTSRARTAGNSGP